MIIINAVENATADNSREALKEEWDKQTAKNRKILNKIHAQESANNRIDEENPIRKKRYAKLDTGGKKAQELYEKFSNMQE